MGRFISDLLLGGGASGRVAREEVRIHSAESYDSNYGYEQYLFRNASTNLLLTSRPGVLDVLDSSIVNSSVTLTNTADVEPVAVVFQTLEAGSGDSLREIN